jgi:hypothetical protein
MKLAVERAQRHGHYIWDLTLPAIAWDRQRQAIAALADARTRSTVAQAYVLADQLNQIVHLRESNGSQVDEDDDLPGLLNAIVRARQALERVRIWTLRSHLAAEALGGRPPKR